MRTILCFLAFTALAAPAIAGPDLEFPKDFIVGTASSDFQTTGGNGNGSWPVYLKERAKTEPTLIMPGIGTDFWNRYDEDYALAERLGIKLHRLSFDWGRLEPVEGRFDLKAAAHYRAIVRSGLRHHVKTMICFNHFNDPEWFIKQGGWTSPKSVQQYVRLVRFIVNNVGKPCGVTWYLTFNEVQVIITLSYVQGKWPPNMSVNGFQDEAGLLRILLVTRHIMDAHRQAYHAIHGIMGNAYGPVHVGMASAPWMFYPNDPNSKLDVTAYNVYNLGSLSIDYLMGSEQDFIGVNYYGYSRLKTYLFPMLVNSLLDRKDPFAIGWDMSSTLDRKAPLPGRKGLRDLLMKFKPLGKPILLTEFGIEDASDRDRPRYLLESLAAVHDARRDGANVIGIMHWSLTDTWEWEPVGHGHLGLIAIDWEHGLRRSFRQPSASIWAEFARTHRISESLLKKYRLLQ